MEDNAFSGADHAARKLWIALGLIVALVLVLSFTAPKPLAPKFPHRKVVRFWHMWTADWEKKVDEICERFNDSQSDYEVIPLSIPGDTADSKFSIAVAGANPPDCMAQWNNVIPKWADSKLLTPLDELMGPTEWQQQKSTMYPAALRVGLYKGHLYGLAVGMNVFALYYRPDMFRAAGLDPEHLPSSLEGLMAWARKLDQEDSNGRLTRVGFLPWGVQNFAPLFGPGFFDWNKGQLTLDTPSNLKAFEFLAKSRSDLGFERVVRFESSLQAGAGGMNAAWPLLTGTQAMVLDGQWRVVDAENYGGKDFQFRTAALPPPAGGRPGGGFCNGNFMIIPSTAHDPEGAWAFIKFWSGISKPERAAEFYTMGGWLPLNKQVAQAPLYRAYIKKHPQFETFVKLLDSPNMEPIPPVPYQNYLWDRLAQAEQAQGMGGQTSRQVLDQLVTETSQELAHRKEFGYVD
jgi:multiple sugar transport system substrate-binding protein